jgi:MYXO-CTERM domain-containing protein
LSLLRHGAERRYQIDRIPIKYNLINPLAAFVKKGAFLDPGFLASATSDPVTILASPSPSSPPPVPPESGGCASCEVGREAGRASLAFAAALAAMGLFAGRRKSR